MSNQIIVLLALLNEKNEVLVSLRKNRADHNGFWEYPGGKVEEGENIDQALIREVKEELNIEISKHCVAPLTFVLDGNERDKKLLLLYVCRKWEGNVTSLLEQKIDWVRPIDLGHYQMPDSNLFLNSMLRDWVASS